ncbi:hypothetical protein V5P93_007352 [Actinokineospora auranticolor]|uniref:Uncharacterized protein n=1 Tax=Actinokineospora auranticolor TaxID=155976 RepID=A0A2S6GRZ5_9PSEU|nr:hypothetical protein [Actinokineospora auranticolor]PPK68004.1 hypothetical protein CLV40_106237 [Actinokineospora auranticolor]
MSNELFGELGGNVVVRLLRPPDHTAWARRVSDRPETEEVTAPCPDCAKAGLRLLGGSIRLLPVPHRARYREEFRAEPAGIPDRGDQFRYAVRLLLRAPALRRSLRDPNRRAA